MVQLRAQSFTARKRAWSGPLAQKLRPEPVQSLKLQRGRLITRGYYYYYYHYYYYYYQ